MEIFEAKAVIIPPSELVECETIIAAGLETFAQVGAALAKIRDFKLYRESGFDTFDDYCRKRWDFGKSYASRLVAASSVVENLLPMGNSPESERQIRPLTRESPDVQRDAWKEATKENPKPTAKDVKKALEKVTKKNPDPVPEKEKPTLVQDPLLAILVQRSIKEFSRYRTTHAQNAVIVSESNRIIDSLHKIEGQLE